MLHYEELTGVALVGWRYGGMIVTGAVNRVPKWVVVYAYPPAGRCAWHCGQVGWQFGDTPIALWQDQRI